MKTTYLIKSIQSDGSAALVETTAEHWHEITENNKLLSKDERRYFITDIISESGKLDCMVMEVPYKEFLHWLADQSPANRNNSLKKKYSHLSLDESVMNMTPISTMAPAELPFTAPLSRRCSPTLNQDL